MNWKEFWNSFPDQFTNDEFLMQVGKTVKGKPISDEQFRLLILDLVQKLDLSKEDIVLDLCCGNGLITSVVAGQCRQIVGVDFSDHLIEVAQKYHSPVNASYFDQSVLDISLPGLNMTRPFTKIYMYEGLQYFQEEQWSPLLQTLLPLMDEKGVLLLAGVPDRDRLWNFYNTPERRRDYEERKRLGTEAIGTWWERSFIEEACSRYGLRCEFLDQPASSHTAHYRFDARIQKQ